MAANKLYDILATLTNKEQKKLVSFVRTPYFNTNQSVTKLIDYVLKYASNWNDAKLEDAAVFSALFPGNDFIYKKLVRLRFEAFSVVEQFLAMEMLTTNEALKKKVLITTYKDRGAGKLFEEACETQKELFETEKMESAEYYYELYDLALSRISFLTHNFERENYIAAHTDLIDTLEIFFILSKLAHYSFCVNNMQSFQQNIEVKEIKRFIAETKEKKYYTSVKLIQMMCLSILLLLDKEDERSFFELRSLLIATQEKIDIVLLKNIYVASKNFCIKRIRLEDLKYEEELFNIYEYEIENNLLAFENGKMPHYSYQNIIKLALRLNKIQWAEAFLENYKELLNEEVKETMYQCCSSYIAFAKKDYVKVQKAISQLPNLTDTLSNMDIRRMLLKTYFERNEWDPLFDNINSFRVYITRNKECLPEIHVHTNRNFISTLEKIAKAIVEEDYSLIKKAELSIEKEEGISEKRWLLDTIEEQKVKIGS